MKKLGIQVPKSFIINTDSAEEEDVLSATKRYDRVITEEHKKLNNKPVP